MCPLAKTEPDCWLDIRIQFCSPTRVADIQVLESSSAVSQGMQEVELEAEKPKLKSKHPNMRCMYLKWYLTKCFSQDLWH